MPITSRFQPPGIPYIGGYYHLYGDSGDNLLYAPDGDNSNTGVLSFDLDGSAGVDPVPLATLSGAPALTIQDFVLI